MKHLSSLLFALFSFSAFSSVHVATIVKMEGDASVYIPGELKDEKVTHVKYLDNVYHIAPAKRGMKVENGFIVNTGTNSKVKMIYNNGDHFYVSPNSQYKVEWKRKQGTQEEDSSTISLIRGAVRGLIDKKGPRSGMKVTTQAVTFAVRGTDFHVRRESADSTQVSVLRGKIVAVDEKNQKEVPVETGQTFIATQQESLLAKATKQELQNIAEDSKIKTEPKDVVPQELKVLEVKATEVTVNDIKTYQPELYKEIENKNLSSDALDTKTVATLVQKAPVKRAKPSLDGVEDKDPYDRYYKPKVQD